MFVPFFNLPCYVQLIPWGAGHSLEGRKGGVHLGERGGEGEVGETESGCNICKVQLKQKKQTEKIGEHSLSHLFFSSYLISLHEGLKL